MGVKLKDILNIVTDIIPLGTVVKTLGKGVGALLTNKVSKSLGLPEEIVEKVLRKTSEEIENDHEIRKMLIEDARADRQHQLDFFGKFSDLDSGSAKLRARMRPLLSFGFCGLFIVYGVIFLCQQLFPHFLGFEFAIIFPSELVTITKVVVGFWFGGRTIEKAVEIIKGK